MDTARNQGFAVGSLRYRSQFSPVWAAAARISISDYFYRAT
jgi:hypothetical protein